MEKGNGMTRQYIDAVYKYINSADQTMPIHSFVTSELDYCDKSTCGCPYKQLKLQLV